MVIHQFRKGNNNACFKTYPCISHIFQALPMQAQIYGVGNLRWQTGVLITLGADSILLTISFNSIGFV